MALTYTPPTPNQVFAMDASGKGHININFTETSTGTVSLILTNLATNAVIPVTLTKSGNNYSAALILPKGKYKYSFADTLVVNNSPTEYVFSVGLVFVIVGHSLAGTGVGNATDHRVLVYENYTAAVDADWKNLAKYTGGTYQFPDVLTTAKIAAGTTAYDTQIGPWARMAQLIAVRDDVPVAIINTNMGGSSMKMWADEAAYRPFEHGFAGGGFNLYNSGLPYFHFENVLKTFGKTNGVTAVLVQHGENDDAVDIELLASYYKTVIDNSRIHSGLTKLPFVIAKSAWLTDSPSQISNKLATIDRVVSCNDYAYVGVDTHSIPQSLRGQPNNAGDGHWNIAGSVEVGRLWAEKLSSAFLTTLANSVSTMPMICNPVVLPVATASSTIPVITANVPVAPTISEKVKSLNWSGFAIITVSVGVLFLLLKTVFKFKFLKTIANVILGISALAIGLGFLIINYFKNQKTMT